MKTLLRYLKPFSLRMTVGFIIKVLGTVIELMLPYILSHILKTVVLTQDIRQIILWGGLMILCAGVGCIMNVIANRMASRVSRNFSEAVRSDLFAATLRLSSSQADRFTVASLESRITTDTYNIHNFVGMMQRMGVRAPILLIGGITITMIMDSYLALVMLAVLPFIFVTVYFISKKGIPLYAKVQRSVDRMIRVVREDAQGIRVIKALSRTEHEHRRYDEVNSSLVRDEKHAGYIMNSVNPIMTFLMNAGIVAVIAMSASRVEAHQSDPETVVAFMQYFTLISMAMMTVTRIFVMCSKSIASAHRIAEVLNAENELPIHSADEFPNTQDEAHIRFSNVCFSYEGKGNDLENVSFELKRGGSLGIIGATGSGKSTLVKLLLRYHDVSGGSIKINGRDVRTIPEQELYAMFGTAMQNDFLYADTIEENLRFGRELTHEQIEKAARIAQAEDFILETADGYGHVLAQKAANLSGGQKQRLLIARALAGKPEILVLDDSSSALDYKTEANLRRALNEHMCDTTVITVAQRVSAVRTCDLILVLDNGRIIGRGTHDELLESCPEYKEISDSQMGGAFID